MDPCECCYYTLQSKTADGHYTCGWTMIKGRRTWWHGKAAHAMWDRNNPDLGINKPGTPQCPCCYYRMVGGAWTGPGWFLAWKNGQQEWQWYSAGAIHDKPWGFWTLREYDGPNATPGGNSAPGSSTDTSWWGPAPWMPAGAISDALEQHAGLEKPSEVRKAMLNVELTGDEPILEDDDDEPITLTLERVLPFANPQLRSLGAVTGEEPILEEQCLDKIESVW
jgi:hypothetical protein